MTDKSYEMIMSHTVQSTNEMYISDAIDIIAMLSGFGLRAKRVGESFPACHSLNRR